MTQNTPLLASLARREPSGDFRSSSSQLESSSETAIICLRRALEGTGHRDTEQRAGVYRFLARTTTHPTPDEVFQGARDAVSGISPAPVYKSFEGFSVHGYRLELTGRCLECSLKETDVVLRNTR